MELKLRDKNVKQRITNGDMKVHMSLGFVVRSRFGSLVALREELQQLFSESFMYPTISSSPLFVVHWNDMTEKKQLEIGNRKSRNERLRKGSG